VSTEVTDAHPDQGMQHGEYMAEVVSEDGTVIGSFPVAGPMSAEEPILGPMEVAVRFAWEGEPAAVKLSDADTSAAVASVDLKQAVWDYCEGNTGDPNCAGAEEPGDNTLLYAGIAALVVIVLVGAFLLRDQLTAILGRKK